MITEGFGVDVEPLFLRPTIMCRDLGVEIS